MALGAQVPRAVIDGALTVIPEHHGIRGRQGVIGIGVGRVDLVAGAAVDRRRILRRRIGSLRASRDPVEETLMRVARSAR